jgi:hypothetical protein
MFEQTSGRALLPFMRIDDYDKKVEVIKDYRAAKDKNAELLRRKNAPAQVELWFDDKHCDFALSGNEMVRLLVDFGDINSVDDLFSPGITGPAHQT